MMAGRGFVTINEANVVDRYGQVVSEVSGGYLVQYYDPATDAPYYQGIVMLGQVVQQFRFFNNLDEAKAFYVANSNGGIVDG